MRSRRRRRRRRSSSRVPAKHRSCFHGSPERRRSPRSPAAGGGRRSLPQVLAGGFLRLLAGAFVAAFQADLVPPVVQEVAPANKCCVSHLPAMKDWCEEPGGGRRRRRSSRGALPLARVELPLRPPLLAAPAFSVPGKVHELAPAQGSTIAPEATCENPRARR